MVRPAGLTVSSPAGQKPLCRETRLAVDRRARRSLTPRGCALDNPNPDSARLRAGAFRLTRAYAMNRYFLPARRIWHVVLH